MRIRGMNRLGNAMNIILVTMGEEGLVLIAYTIDLESVMK